MRNNKGYLLIFAVIFVLLLGIAVYYLLSNQEGEMVSELTVREIVESQYGGSSITSLEKNDKTFVVLMENDMGQYQMLVNGLTGEITSLKLINRKGEDSQPNGQDGEESETPQDTPKPSMLTKDQAIEIALDEVHGAIEDIELDEKNGIKVYEVEIEVNDDTEATIIINAYTGEILSLTWD
ncbi:PepSY domain-containing protein [Sutcliffiella rhizosphaerae]|uniref:PepSY domain-containing protein n=1 Tax=Sutcliffiella rhizosphaerae TaxID=2880967 RepID=A0ABM8YQ70_9BACI|nr:PepSY domain-containing protein [Sutcliffiella rhizosphaerae]CAG9622065.1 hypothetical protein BACCIP111883_02856 [Sutcliffiella rhizosphaerae]